MFFRSIQIGLNNVHEFRLILATYSMSLLKQLSFSFSLYPFSYTPSVQKYKAYFDCPKVSFDRKFLLHYLPSCYKIATIRK
uniref:Uncharacterized protein n=1 Tax=Arundo donax TaxID=35708 RepID=A0A0A8YW55_ARUDO